MKDAGLARKRRGNHGHANTRQTVVHDETSNQIEETVLETSSASATSSGSSNSTPKSSNSSATSSSSMELQDLDMRNPANWTVVPRSSELRANFIYTLPPSLSLGTGYERARLQFGIDLSQLTIMTNFNMNAHAFQTFATDPLRLASLMEDKYWSYLEFVPFMYDSNKCLAAAADCLLAKVSSKLLPYNDDGGVAIRLYAKALQLLQNAIVDSSSSTDAETLCAIQLMSLHELLEPGREAAWAAHVQGSARLVRHRNTMHFKGDFEKALFAGHAGPVVSDALGGNTHCYLADPAWSKLYSSIAQESSFLTERSGLVISSRKLMFHLPGLWHDTGHALRGNDLFDDDVLGSLEMRCRELHAGFLDWLEEYKSHCVRTSLVQPPPSEIGLRREIFGASVECLCISKRLLACVCDGDRLALEVESQALARFMLDLQKQPNPKHSFLFTPHETNVAMSIKASQESFDEDLREEDSISQRLAMRRRYFAWDGLLRAPQN